jgi:uncharacterized protein (TIGR03067 family)
MKRLCSVIAITFLVPWSLLAGGAQPAGDAAKEELKKLQGKWKILSAEMGGKEVGIAKLGLTHIEFKDEKMSLIPAGGKAPRPFGIKLDPSKKPRHMDWTKLDEKDAKPLPAIYALDGDNLKLCFPLLPSKDEKLPIPIMRPESFDTKEKPYGLLIAKREKP